MFVTVQTANNANPVMARVKSVNNSGFNVALFNQNSAINNGIEETVGYLAVYDNTSSRSGTATIQGASHDYTLTYKRVTTNWTYIDRNNYLKLEAANAAENLALLNIDGHLFAQDIIMSYLLLDASGRYYTGCEFKALYLYLTQYRNQQ